MKAHICHGAPLLAYHPRRCSNLLSSASGAGKAGQNAVTSSCWIFAQT